MLQTLAQKHYRKQKHELAIKLKTLAKQSLTLLELGLLSLCVKN
jgi:uncharacterized UBP type Zn finger protein